MTAGPVRRGSRRPLARRRRAGDERHRRGRVLTRRPRRGPRDGVPGGKRAIPPRDDAGERGRRPCGVPCAPGVGPGVRIPRTRRGPRCARRPGGRTAARRRRGHHPRRAAAKPAAGDDAAGGDAAGAQHAGLPAAVDRAVRRAAACPGESRRRPAGPAAERAAGARLRGRGGVPGRGAGGDRPLPVDRPGRRDPRRDPRRRLGRARGRQHAAHLAQRLGGRARASTPCCSTRSARTW